jgi:glycosyltransferase involved in cell wall biosynthesis
MEKVRILVVTAQTPFVYGGGEYHGYNLASNLKKQGHQVEEVKIPFKWYPPEKILDQILSVRLLDLTESCGKQIDLVIGLKFPAYFIKHTNKVLWILHQHRPAYDLWGTEFSDLSGNKGIAVREAIIKADNVYIPEARKIFTNSKNVSNRLKKFNNIDSEPLYHPPPNMEKLYSNSYENYIFYPSRLTAMKRQHIAIEAMRYVKGNIKLIIAGGADSESYEENLKELIAKYNLYNKVALLGMIPEEKKLELYANALAVLFIPYDEDYGYVTLEAFYSKKAVITCNDSGGPLEFVQDKYTGLICNPEPGSIAEAINNLAGNRDKALKYGKDGYASVKELNLSWDKVVETLIQ